MINNKRIKSFMFDYAQYEIEDINKNKGLLIVNYKDNKYNYIGSSDKYLLIEISKIATDLLAKKHKVNFAEKL